MANEFRFSEKLKKKKKKKKKKQSIFFKRRKQAEAFLDSSYVYVLQS